MVKNIPWHGKITFVENKCPHCGANDGHTNKDNNEYSDIAMNVMELSAQHFKLCIKCQGEFVDTYLIDFADDYFSEDNWKGNQEWDNKDIDQVELFHRLEKEGFLTYDDYDGRKDSDYYKISPQSINFIKGALDE